MSIYETDACISYYKHIYRKVGFLYHIVIIESDEISIKEIG